MSPMSSLACIPCQGTTPPFSAKEATRRLHDSPGWVLKKGATRLTRSFRFPDFKQSLAFVNRVGALAEAQGHHPEVRFGWGFCEVEIYTHKIDGLHQNDFILAAKINALG
ncbi:MAG: pterin-4-alpha-carbinolamine dehydratase [Alphaproteobacteria bacterium RIFOXYD12_FULL_60_8]|nr:MAG: pterin-4-alpha-carbinolamine dehydratase [Alphaproteobacteria bacterium RIFOXYD12_FULL_60_8]